MGAFEAIKAMGYLDEGLKTWAGAAQTAYDVATFPALAQVPIGSAPVGIDIFPTWVTPDDARRYIGEINASYERLQASVPASSVSRAFKDAWATQYKAWIEFRDPALKDMGWFNAKSTMNQTDRYAQTAREWHEAYMKEPGAGAVPGPVPAAPQVPAAESSEQLGPKLETAFYIVAAIAGVVAVGYLIHAVKPVAVGSEAP